MTDDADAVVTAAPARRRSLTPLALLVCTVVLGGLAVWQVVAQLGGAAPADSPLALVGTCQRTPGCQVVRLTQPGSGKPMATLVTKADHATLITTRLAATRAGTDYVLWQRSGGTTKALVTLTVPSNNDQVVVDTTLSVPYADTTQFLVSQERVDTTPARPTTVVAAG